MLADQAPPLSTTNNGCNRTIERIPPVKFANQPQIFDNMPGVSTVCYKFAIGMPAVEDARLLNAAIGAPSQEFKAELQISQQSVCRVPDKSFGSGPPNHQIRWASDRVDHSA